MQVFVRVVTLAAVGASVLGQSVTSFESAVASSTYASGSFSANAAISKGGSYWCSAGGHAPGQIVTWTGALPARVTAIGVKLNWAYGPGEFKLLTSADGGNFEDVFAWRKPDRNEVSYEATFMFDAPRNVKTLTVAMRSPMPWSYFGLNDVALLIESGPTLLLSGASSPKGELCLVTAGGGVAVEGCLEAIANGAGKEVFSFNDKSQIVSVVDGRCVVMANGDAVAGGKLSLQDCSSAEEAGDGRSEFEIDSAGHLRIKHLKNYCVALRSTGAIVGDCDTMGESALIQAAAVPEFDEKLGNVVKDLATMLASAASRQRSLLTQLQESLPLLKTCSYELVRNSTSIPQLSFSSADVSSRGVASQDDPAMQSIAMIDGGVGLDLTSIKELLKESTAVLESVASGNK